jgi:adenine-specific DNA-methyltransferase
MIKYLGSKRTLIPRIMAAVGECAEAKTVLDLFSGTSRVGHALKAAGYRVLANDHNAYAAAIARCYVQADAEDHAAAAAQLIAELNALPGCPGYVTETFCLQSRYFQPHNGERIDAIRDAIAAKSLDPELEAVLLVSLMEAADRVDSTVGVQMAYLKSWAPRARNRLELRLPKLLPRATHGKGQAHALDAFDAATQLEADVAYVDPPYNQHSYLGNYHIWETLVRWDKPDTYGIARKRTDCRERQSQFNAKKTFANTLVRLLQTTRAKTIILSFSNEGYVTQPQLETLLKETFPTRPFRRKSINYKRYVGAQIGIYNPAGKKVGKVSHLRNKEYLYVV